jgi:hypothetical protein
VEKPVPIDSMARPIPLKLLLLAALAVHLPLMMLKLPLKTYDTNLHIFFASHYLHHWFNPWNPKWYAGFSQTTYPPLTHQWIAAVSPIFGLEYGYMAVQLAGILLLVVGIYRFALLWVSPRAASIAALASIFLGAESFLVYNAGQLATTCAAPIYLNALPFLYEWVRRGGWKPFVKATAVFTAAAAAHHATLIFGSLLFAVPVLALAWRDRDESEPLTGGQFAGRTAAIVLTVAVTVTLVLLPFWIALIHYPVTQTPIPHPSRANYILSPNWAVTYFLVPYGAMILALPFIFMRGSTNRRLRPLLLGFWLTFLLGLGGTTPVGYYLLGRAFEVLTFERFSYWASLMALPFIGILVEDLVARFRTAAGVVVFILAGVSCGVAAAWTHYVPVQEGEFDVRPVADWLNGNGHDQYRYITLGFGSNQISRLSMLANANSVDGSWNSGRMLPELMMYGGAELTSAKYYGQGGMDSLRAILRHADKYGLKWIFSYDHDYDPLLYFSGWNRVGGLEDNTITIWSKSNVPPATPRQAAQIPPVWQGILWGTLPFGSSLLAILVLLIPEEKRHEQEWSDAEQGWIVPEETLPERRAVS